MRIFLLSIALFSCSNPRHKLPVLPPGSEQPSGDGRGQGKAFVVLQKPAPSLLGSGWEFNSLARGQPLRAKPEQIFLSD